MTYKELWNSLLTVYARQEAEAVVRMVLSERFGVSFTDIVSGCLDTFSDSQNEELGVLMKRLQTGEPVQYVLGSTRFCGREFHVAPGVLIPRPETEELCAIVIRSMAEGNVSGNMKISGDVKNILDMGTGSGCIAITLALDVPGSNVEAWDVSPAALNIARGNACALNADVDFKLVNMLTKEHAEGGRWDVIVSNPPYICDREREQMERNVLDYEPATALFVPDDDPLLFYKAIKRYADASLREGGLVCMEVNSFYAADVAALFTTDEYDSTEIVDDMYGRQRFIRTNKKAIDMERITEEKALQRLGALCAKSEQCSGDMIEKMRRWGLDEGSRVRIMEYLTTHKFVDDSRYCPLFVSDKVRFSKWGRYKIEQALRMKHISEDVYGDALNSVTPEEYADVLMPLLRSKARQIKAKSCFEFSQKLIKYAAGRGYDMDVIRMCLADGCLVSLYDGDKDGDDMQQCDEILNGCDD